MSQKGSRENRRMVTNQQIRGARGLLGWSQTELAVRAGLSLPTVKRAEAESGVRASPDARTKITAALEAAGIEFTNGDEPGVKLRRGAAGQLGG